MIRRECESSQNDYGLPPFHARLPFSVEMHFQPATRPTNLSEMVSNTELDQYAKEVKIRIENEQIWKRIASHIEFAEPSVEHILETLI